MRLIFLLFHLTECLRVDITRKAFTSTSLFVSLCIVCSEVSAAVLVGLLRLRGTHHFFEPWQFGYW